MNCMKCGREVKEGQVFCWDCLADMEKYPVKPGTVVQLPRHRSEPAVYKKVIPRKKVLTPEEQVKKLKRRIRRMAVGILILLAVIATLLYPMVAEIIEGSKPRPGQNYSSQNDPQPVENSTVFGGLLGE